MIPLPNRFVNSAILMRRKPCLQEVAEASGVSKTTASHVLSDKGRVSPKTRARVRKVAAELGYRPHHLARSLATGHSQALGVVTVGLRGSWYADCVEAIEDCAVDHGYSLLLGCSRNSPQRERELIENFLHWNADGLIVLSHWPEGNADLFRDISLSGRPLVFIYNEVPGASADSVATDDFLAGYLAGQHLARVGRKAVLFMGAVDIFSWARTRREGCDRALQEVHLPPTELLNPGTAATDHECAALAHEALARRLGAGSVFDAVFAANDPVAWGALAALADYGIRVPEEVAVVGFDDREASAFTRPPLTTFRHAMRRMGQQAVEMLIQRLEASSRDGQPRRLLFEPTLVVRESCGGRPGAQANHPQGGG